MADPVERIRLFVEDQRQQARSVAARAAWRAKLPELVPAVESVVDVMRDSLMPDQFRADAVCVLTDRKRDRFPLVVAFGARAGSGPEPEIGASAAFRCEEDGRVYGYRYPFHSVMNALEPEPFADLGDPEALTPAALGNAVAEFLEWATTGAGCGGTRLQFGAPSTLPFVRPQAKRSGIAA